MNISNFCLLMIALLTASTPAFANVIVSSPQTGQTVDSTVKFVASANTSTCSRGVAAMGIYVDHQLMYVVNGTSVSTALPLTIGRHLAVVQEWDFCGGTTTTSVPLTVAGQGGVWVTSPTDQSNVSSLTSYVATATTSCPTGVAAMGIYVNNLLVHVSNGATLNTQINLASGPQQTVVQQWDNCGGASKTPVTVNVQGVGTTLKNIQSSIGWKSSGQLAPRYDDCELLCGNAVTWSMAQGVTSPSLSGNATRFNLGGTTPYSDALFYNQLIGTASTQGLPDTSRTIVPALHNFSYDGYFYVADPANTQAMEFDINMFPGGSVGMTWGTECRIAGGNEWDIWDNVQAKWLPTGYACNIATGWNHVTVNAQRGPNNTLIYQSITLNGLTSNINKTYDPFVVPADWYGVTANFQMDGNHMQTPITSYLDNFSFTYW